MRYDTALPVSNQIRWTENVIIPGNITAERNVKIHNIILYLFIYMDTKCVSLLDAVHTLWKH
jgi:hypothetical protein